jgi:hypothetical protein
MPADRRQTQRRKQTIEISDRTAADQRNGSAGQIEQALERLKQRVRNMHFARRRTDIDDRAIHVEQKRNRFQIKLGKNIHGVIGNRRHYYNPYAARRFGRTAVFSAPSPRRHHRRR